MAMAEHELAELVGRIGNLYTRKGLSPPFHLRNAVDQWSGLSQDEIVAVIEKHFQDCRRFYTAGSGCQHFNMVRAAIGKALDAKSPRRERAEDAPVQPRRRRGVTPVYAAGGFTEAIDDREDDISLEDA